MTQETAPLPRFFKDSEGFCYIATALLAEAPGLTPWNGAVSAAGLAVEGPVAGPLDPAHRVKLRAKGLAKPSTEE